MNRLPALFFALMTFFGGVYSTKLFAEKSSVLNDCQFLLSRPFEHVIIGGSGRVKMHVQEIRSHLDDFLRQMRPLVPVELTQRLAVVEFIVEIVDKETGEEFGAIQDPNYVALVIPQQMLHGNLPNTTEKEKELWWKKAYVLLSHEFGHLIQLAYFAEHLPISQEIFKSQRYLLPVSDFRIGSRDAMRFMDQARANFKKDSPKQSPEYERLKSNCSKLEVSFNEFGADFIAGTFANDLDAIDKSFASLSTEVDFEHYGKRKFDPALANRSDDLPKWVLESEYFWLPAARGVLAQLLPVIPLNTTQKCKLIGKGLKALLEATNDILANGQCNYLQDQNDFLSQHLRTNFAH